MKRQLIFGLLGLCLLLPTLASTASQMATPVVWPVGGTTTPDTMDKPFGFRILCGACTDPDDADFHRGIDFNYAHGTPVHAVHSGVVVRVNHGPGYDPDLPRWGNFVVVALSPIILPNGVVLQNHKVAYLHLDSVTAGLAVGSQVTRGDALGTIGNTGDGISSTHLHLDYYQGTSDADIHREEARSPLEILPHKSVAPTVTVSKLSNSTLRVTVRQDPTSLDVVRFRVEHDGLSNPHGGDPIVIDFNEKIGIGMSAPDFEDENPFEGTTFLPKYFNYNSSYYELKLDFDGDWSDLQDVDVTLTNARDVQFGYSFTLP